MAKYWKCEECGFQTKLKPLKGGGVRCKCSKMLKQITKEQFLNELK